MNRKIHNIVYKVFIVDINVQDSTNLCIQNLNGVTKSYKVDTLLNAFTS
jgi:hypothetical protein